MKIKGFFKKLDDELSKSVPPLSDELLNAPITLKQADEDMATTEIKEKTTSKFWSFFTPVRIGALATSILICFLAVFGIIRFGGNKKAVSDSVILQIDINPSVSLLLDSDMKVERVVSNNSDGDLILKAEGFLQEIVGKKAEEGVKLVAEEARKLGFIDAEKRGENGEYNNLLVSAKGNKEKLPENLLEDISTTVIEYFNSSGIYLFVECVNEGMQEFETQINNVKNQAQLYYEGIKESKEQLISHLNNLFFEYCNELLTFSLNKYDLYFEINELNEKIKQEENGLGDYWVNAIVGNVEDYNQEMGALLDELYNVYGEDYRELSIENSVAFATKMAIYDPENIDFVGLKQLAVDKIDANSFEENADLILDFILISAEEFISDAIDFYKMLGDATVQSLQDMVNGITDRLLQTKENLYSIVSNVPITNEEYQAFLQLIGKK